MVAAAATPFAAIYGVAEGGDDGFERFAELRRLHRRHVPVGPRQRGTGRRRRSTPTRRRRASARGTMILFGLYLLASTLGPLVTIVMFVLHGNEWALADIRNVILAGMGIAAAPSCSSSATSTRSRAPTRRRCRRAGGGARRAGRADVMRTAAAHRRRRRRRHRVARDDLARHRCGSCRGSLLLLAVLRARQRDDGERSPSSSRDCAMSPVGVRCIYVAPRADGADVGDRHQAAPSASAARRRWSSSRSSASRSRCSMAYLNTNWLHDGGGEPSSGDGDRTHPDVQGRGGRRHLPAAHRADELRRTRSRSRS